MQKKKKSTELCSNSPGVGWQWARLGHNRSSVIVHNKDGAKKNQDQDCDISPNFPGSLVLLWGRRNEKPKFWLNLLTLPSHFSPTADITHQSQQSLSQHSLSSQHPYGWVIACTHTRQHKRTYTHTSITLICYLASRGSQYSPQYYPDTFLPTSSQIFPCKHNWQRRASVPAQETCR